MVCEKERQSGRREGQNRSGASQEDQRAHGGKERGAREQEYPADHGEPEGERDSRRIVPVLVLSAPPRYEPRYEIRVASVVADRDEALVGSVDEDGTSVLDREYAGDEDARPFDERRDRAPTEALYRPRFVRRLG